MPRTSPERRRLLLDIHGWTALCLGLLLYLVVVTGMVSVVADEIGSWSSPLRTSPVHTVPAGINGAVRSLSREVPARHHEEVTVFARTGGRLQTFFHDHGTHPDTGELAARGVEFDLDPVTFEVLDRREGWSDEIERRNRSSALSHFLTELHIRLHIPDPYGLWLTALAGFAVSVALVTGLFMQRRPLRNLLTWRRRAERTVAARDSHVVTGTWILPFFLLVAVTGSYLSFVFSIGFPAMAEVAYEGDEVALFGTLFGVPAAADPRPSRQADLDAMITDVKARSGTEPNFVAIERWGRADSVVTMFTGPAAGDIGNRSYVYGGADGEFRFEKPVFGTSPSPAGSLAAAIDPLHFGSFAGVLSKVVWVALGFMGARVVMTGLLYGCRRRGDEPAWRLAHRVVYWMGYGLPMALAAAAYGYFPARAAGLTETGGYIASAFLLAVALATVVLFVARSPASLKRSLQGISGVLLLGLPWLRQLCGGPGWSGALQAGVDVVIVMDAVLLAAGAALLLPAVARRGQEATNGGRRQEVLQAAGTE